MLKLIKEKLSSGMGRDVVWTFSIQLLIMLCSFAINKLLASRLSIDDFGQLTDLIGSLCDLTSGSGDKGTPIVYIQGYFDNYTTE